jgi:hypothetical protein
MKTFKLLKPLSGKLIRDEDNIVILEATWEESDFMFGVEIITKNREEEAFLQRTIANRPRNIGSLEFDHNGEAICPIKTFSMKKLQEENKNTMAHIMFELGIFKSVGEARKNGWNKPLELGEFCVTKKKIKFEVIE